MVDRQAIFERWWLYKFIEDGRQIVKVEFIGAPSGVTGIVILTLDDGSEMHPPRTPYDFLPRKKNFKVFDKNPKKMVK